MFVTKLNAFGQSVVAGPATLTALRIPAGIAYDTNGNLYFAESGSQVVCKVDGTGTLTTVAGTGVQGFFGDGGPAVLARLDSPSAVAVDKAGTLFVADAHNHRIRRLDSSSGVISTIVGTGFPGLSPEGSLGTVTEVDLPSALAVNASGDLYFADAGRHVVRRLDHSTNRVTTIAGNGIEGWSGDGGPATLAAIDSPRGIALDAAGDLYLSDTHNQRVRRVDHTTGVIRSVAGTGAPGYGGDGGDAAGAKLNLPRGLVLDGSGNLFIVDSNNERLRAIDAISGQIRTIAGTGGQGFAGDGLTATTALLDGPQAVALDANGSQVFSDTRNQRIRRIDGSGVIATISGLGAAPMTVLTLTVPASVTYGTGTMLARMAGNNATGSVAFFDDISGTALRLGVAALTSGTATFPLDTLSAGSHRLTATYAGDTVHPPSQSISVGVSVMPAPLTVAPVSVSLLYGQTVPPLSGTFSGLLARDAGLVSVAFTSSAGALAAPGTYPIGALLSGASAGNYAVSTGAAAVTISRAPSLSTISAALTAHIAPTTAGTPTGTASLLDGGSAVATSSLSGSGDASFTSTALSSGSHTISVRYNGDVDFLPSVSAPVLLSIGAGTPVDFSLASSDGGSQSITAGSEALFALVATPSGGSTVSQIVLSVAGLPAGASASFSPAYLPPGSAAMPFTLTVRTLKTSSLAAPSGRVVALLLGFLALSFGVRRRRRLLVLPLLMVAVGCGDRVNSSAGTAGTARSYNLTVTATGTSASGASLLHSTVVTLTLL